MSKNEVKLEIILYFAQKCKMQEERRQVENSKKIFSHCRFLPAFLTFAQSTISMF